MNRKRILVIEDEQGIRETLKLVLEIEGYEVLLAANGHEALDLLKSIPRPGIIFLDLMMPVMDGFEFLAFRMKDNAIASIPVVIVSAFPDQVSKLNQVQGFVKKPVNLDQLLAFAEQYCI